MEQGRGTGGHARGAGEARRGRDRSRCMPLLVFSPPRRSLGQARNGSVSSSRSSWQASHGSWRNPRTLPRSRLHASATAARRRPRRDREQVVIESFDETGRARPTRRPKRLKRQRFRGTTVRRQKRIAGVSIQPALVRRLFKGQAIPATRGWATPLEPIRSRTMFGKEFTPELRAQTERVYAEASQQRKS